MNPEDKFKAEIAYQFMLRNPEYIPCQRNVDLFELWLKITKSEFTITSLERAYADFGDYMIKREKLVSAGWKPVTAWKWRKWTIGFWTDPENKTLFGIDIGPLEIVWRYKGYKP